MVETIDGVRRSGITQAELDRAKTQLRAQLVFDEDSVTSVAHQIGYFATVARIDVFTELPARIAAATLDDVFEAARKMLVPSNRTVGLFDPGGSDG
jgi:zinc protease